MVSHFVDWDKAKKGNKLKKKEYQIKGALP